MRENGVGIVWIAGAAGSSEPPAAWAVFCRLAGLGVRVSHVDIDHLATDRAAWS